MVFCVSSTTLFRCYLNLFQLLGLCPVVFSHSRKLNSSVLILISFLHISLLTLVVIFVYAFSRFIFFYDGSFGQFNDTFLYIVVTIAYYSIIIESYLKRGTQSNIWKLLARCHQTDLLDGIDHCKLWNPKEFNNYFIGLSCLKESHSNVQFHFISRIFRFAHSY